MQRHSTNSNFNNFDIIFCQRNGKVLILAEFPFVNYYSRWENKTDRLTLDLFIKFLSNWCFSGVYNCPFLVWLWQCIGIKTFNFLYNWKSPIFIVNCLANDLLFTFCILCILKVIRTNRFWFVKLNCIL